MGSRRTGMCLDGSATSRPAYAPPVPKAPAALALLACLAVMTGCLPERFTIDLRPARAGLEESVVLEDDAAGPAALRIALIHLDGLIADADIPTGLTTTVNPVDEFVARLQKAADDPGVRAIVVRINSPGGTVGGSDILFNELRRFRERTGKPVVVSMGEIAASGGYYVALAADRILAEEATITGSIGVIIQTVNVSEGLSMIGVEARAITSGPNKDLANPLEASRERHYEILAGIVQEQYDRFRALVKAQRPGVRAQDLEMLTDGRIVTGMTAAERGLVDANGGVREAFEEAKALAGVSRARMVTFHPEGLAPRSPYSARAPMGTPAFSAGGGDVEVNVVQVRMAGAMGGLPPGFYYLWRP